MDNTQKFKERVQETKNNGQQFIIVRDNDDKEYESGFADWLMRNYHWDNMGSGFRANLNLPSNRVPGGEFADPNY